MWVQEEPRECHFQGQLATKSSHLHHQITVPEMASDLFQCNFPLTNSPGEVSHFLSIPVAGWRALTVAAPGRINSRFPVWCSWRALVCARGFWWCYLSQAFLTPCLQIFLVSSTYLWRHSRTITRGCKADSLSPRHQEDTCILIYIRIEEGSDLVPCWCSTAHRSQHIWKISKGWWVIQCWLFQLCGKLQTQQLYHICET